MAVRPGDVELQPVPPLQGTRLWFMEDKSIMDRFAEDSFAQFFEQPKYGEMPLQAQNQEIFLKALKL